MVTDIKFRPVKDTEKKILASDPIEGKLYFATDTKKIYLADKEDFLPMGGNSGIYYGNMVLDYEPDSDQEDFEFKLSDIDGNQVPNADDLILNIDGCFYRVISNERIDDEGNPIIDTKKLTVAGSGGTGGGGGGSTISRITIKDLDGNAQKYYTADVTEAKLRFNVTSTLLEGNSIIEMTYQIGNNVVKEDLEVYPFGDFEFDLMPYFSQLNKSTTNTITIKVIDLAGT